MFTWKRSIIVTSWRAGEGDDISDLQVEAFKERVVRFFEGLAKGALAAVLYGSGTVVLSGVLFYFSWKLGIAALFVLGGLLPLAASAYLLWRMMRRGAKPGRRKRKTSRSSSGPSGMTDSSPTSSPTPKVSGATPTGAATRSATPA